MQYNLFYKQQSGFLPGHSTIDQLLAITTYIFDNFEQNKDLIGVFLDVTAAFDKIPHDLLLTKIRSYGIRGNAFEIIKSYLNNRKINVRVNDQLSNLSENNYINCGVPQGSILGPLLFLLYINDLPDALQSLTFIYADDTSLYIPVDPINPDPSIALLREDLSRLSEWSNKWEMDFKPSKSVLVNFTKCGAKNYGTFKLNNVDIPTKNYHKHLGFILDKNLSFNDHVDHLAVKVQKLINPLKHLSKKLKSCYLNTIYKSFVAPHYDYGDILYSGANQEFLKKLDQVHYNAAILVSGCIHGSNTDKVLSLLNWQSSKSRRLERQKIYMFKVSKGLTPIYVLSIFSPLGPKDQRAIAFTLRPSSVRRPS